MLWRMAGSLVAGLTVATVSFFIFHKFQLDHSSSIAISVGMGAVVFVGGFLDFLKKFLEVAKLGYEVKSKHREEKEYREAERQKSSPIIKPSAVEIAKYGVSYAEREIDFRIKTAEKERVEAKGFVSDSRDL